MRRSWRSWGGSFDGLDDRRKGVAEDHRPPGAEVVDVAVAVGVGEPRALGVGDERRGSADGAEGPDGRVDAAGEVSLGALLEGLGSGADGGSG